MRVGVVDLGTNSTRLLVADVDGTHVEEVSRRTNITRLGEGVDERRKLLPLPVARVRNVLSDYRRELEQLGAERVLAIGTSALRDADNGEAFLGEVEWSYGFATRLLSGDEEAELTRRGVSNGRVLPDETLVLDVGGGSTQLTTAAARASLGGGGGRPPRAAPGGGATEPRRRLRSPHRAAPPLGPAHGRGAPRRRGSGARRPTGHRAAGSDRRRRHAPDSRRSRARGLRPRRGSRPPALSRRGRKAAGAPRLPPTRAAA